MAELISWQYCKNPNAINDAILNNDSNWFEIAAEKNHKHIAGRSSRLLYCFFGGLTMNDWISVKDRLPEDLQSVLVLRRDGGIFIWMYRKESPTDDVWIDDYSNVFSIYDSTHWMPLPEPPKEVEDG